jgi:polyisoprenoid-binding protein YceI
MTSTVWTAVAALSALGLVASPVTSPPRTTAAAAPMVVGGPPDTLVANPGASSIRWKGTGFGGHGASAGTVKLASGLFVLRHEKLTSGTFTIDMRSLDGALRSADFLDVERYPTAVFRSTGAQRIGPARWQVAGDLTMRGVTKPITFDTDVGWPELGHMVATSSFMIDRRQWGIATRGSGLADDLVDDHIQLSISLDARRKQAAVAVR